MKTLILFGLLSAFALFAGCATTTGAVAEKNASSCASCETCVCESCACCGTDGPCAECAAGKACACCAGEGKEACTSCESGEACTTCATKDKSSEAQPAVPTEPVATIDAKGMGCPLCASSADRRLKKVDGVMWTNIDLGNGLVTIGLDPNKPTPTAEDLKAAVQDAGFTAEKVTLPEGEVAQ